MRTTKKEKRVMAFLLLLLTITVGYALLSQTLEINGTSKIKKTTWKVIWDNVVVSENSVSGDAVTSAASITNPEKTLVEYSITLSKPGDFYEFTVDAKNEGTIDAMINVLSNKVYESNGTTEKELPEYLTYSVTYSDDKEIQKNHLLKSGSTETYKVRVEFADVTADKLPSEEETLKFKFSVDYVQADKNATNVGHTRTVYTTNDNNIAIRISPGEPLPTNLIQHATTEDVIAAAMRAENHDIEDSQFFLRHTLVNDIVTESYVGFSLNSIVSRHNPGVTAGIYYLKNTETRELVNENWQCKAEYDDGEGNCIDPHYNEKKAILLSAFGSSNCSESSSMTYCSLDARFVDTDDDEIEDTYIDSIYARVGVNGYISVADENWGCYNDVDYIDENTVFCSS